LDYAVIKLESYSMASGCNCYCIVLLRVDIENVKVLHVKEDTYSLKMQALLLMKTQLKYLNI